VTGDTVPDSIALDQGDPDVLLGEHQGGRDSDDAPADDRHVNLQVARESGPLRLGVRI
jgi:hypothetical protein